MFHSMNYTYNDADRICLPRVKDQEHKNSLVGSLHSRTSKQCLLESWIIQKQSSTLEREPGLQKCMQIDSISVPTPKLAIIYSCSDSLQDIQDEAQPIKHFRMKDTQLVIVRKSGLYWDREGEGRREGRE